MQQLFKLRRSLYFAALLLAAHCLALAVLMPLVLPVWAKVAMSLLIIFSVGYHLRHDALLASGSSVVALKLEGKQALLTLRGGRLLEGEVLHDSLVTPYISVLNVLPQGARFARSVVIFPDSLDKESFRQLRVLLKWGR